MSTKRALQSVVDVATGMAGRVIAANRLRRTERLIARFSNRELEDIGFERDWDGSVYRPSDCRA